MGNGTSIGLDKKQLAKFKGNFQKERFDCRASNLKLFKRAIISTSNQL